MQLSFLIAGAQKCGTTALYAHLESHPELSLARPKETHFFDTDEHFVRQPVDYSPLHAHFQSGSGRMLGEATPITMYWSDAPRRVWEYNPAMRIICLLRNPIERAYSHWNMESMRGMDDFSFLEALRREPERCRDVLPLQHRIHSYQDRGYYSEQIRRLWRFFPRNQTLFLKSEDLKHHTQSTLNQVFDFLGVTRQSAEPQIVHAGSYAAPMEPAAREHLVRAYSWEIRELERLLDWDCHDWLPRA